MKENAGINHTDDHADAHIEDADIQIKKERLRTLMGLDADWTRMSIRSPHA